MANATVAQQGAEEEGLRTSIKLDEDMHFRLKWTSVVLRMSMQDCIKEAIDVWLATKVDAVQDAIRKSAHKIAPHGRSPQT